MKLTYVIPLTILILFGLAAPAQAQNPEHLKQLFETRACANCDLANADLRQAHLIGADLRDANLRGANLTEANLEGADLTGADLTGANLTQAFLTNASLNDTTLVRTNLTRATLLFTEAREAKIQDIILTGADIYRTPISVGGPDR